MTKTQNVRVGDPAPDFTLTGADGKRVKLSDFRGRDVVLYFYPKDFTPGCTQEACDFRDAWESLSDRGAAVLGISPDPADRHAAFIKEHKLPFQLLADTDKTVAMQYGVWQEKSMYGKFFMGVQRATFCIGSDGRVKAVFPKVKVKGHVQEVLQALAGD